MKQAKPQSEDAWWQKNFPTRSAREAADAAVDKLPVEEPMSRFIDTWVEAYTAAGGRRGRTG